MSTSQRLSPDRIRDWQTQIGALDPIGDNSTRLFRRTGADGLANYLPAVEMVVDDPTGFDEVAYWRPLSDLLVYVLIRTPCTMRRDPALIDEYPSQYAIVGTQTFAGGGLLRQAGQELQYRHPNHLLVLNNSEPYEHTAYSVADLAGLWIPLELLGRDTTAGQAALAPVVADTPLARAAAAFVRNFAYDVAVRGADVDPDTELAAIDLVRAAVGQRQAVDTFADLQNRPVFVREATRTLIEQNFRDPAFGAESIAKALHMSRRHLYRHFADIDETPATMIATRRLERARELLSHWENAGLEAIAAASGFTSAATLRNRFRAEYDMTPNEYRRDTLGGAAQPGSPPGDTVGGAR
ncbi:helix-turn-helix domain-containing protein [Gordonia sp. NPDC003376]